MASNSEILVCTTLLTRFQLLIEQVQVLHSPMCRSNKNGNRSSFPLLGQRNACFSVHGNINSKITSDLGGENICFAVQLSEREQQDLIWSFIAEAKFKRVLQLENKDMVKGFLLQYT